ncbi:uncharacterized protein SOCEGT47_026660 [Sorangium cellulosum]|uniref:histidine kinase n=1 Tax=Sorangium cellulosum TaxID=56 RepID=A0A4P2PZ23_SORCE|nr:uncharacterized protein SOCEGT47_026660 [Sorangium cellulosum]
MRTRVPRRSKTDVERRAPRSDAAERERLEEQIRQLERRAASAERMLRETVSTISHDLRNSLSVIVVSARMLMRSAPPDGPGRRQLDAITRAADEINQLAQDLVDAMNIENGSLKVGMGAHDVAPIVDRAIELVAPTVALKPLDIAKEVPDDLPPIACDRERIVQVVANLLGSALRYTPKGGRITVRAEPSGSDARFSISDTGPGIPSDQQALLFARTCPPAGPWARASGSRPSSPRASWRPTAARSGWRARPARAPRSSSPSRPPPGSPRAPPDGERGEHALRPHARRQDGPRRESQRRRIARPSDSFSSDAHSLRWCACAFSPGPKFTAGTPSSAKRATSVHACFASTAATPASRSATTSGCDACGGADGLRSRQAISARPPTSASMSRCASRIDVPGGKRWFRFIVNSSGTTFRPRPPCASVAVVTARYTSPSISTSRGARAASSTRSGPAL